jgi:molecular chaperone GrpE (heat shock protein)
LTCDLCGCDIIRDPQEKPLANGEKRVYPYYRCTGGKSTEWYQEHFGKPKCPMYYGPYWLESEIDEAFESAIENLYVDPETHEWVQKEIEDDYRNLKEMAAEEIRSLKAQAKTNETNILVMVQRAAVANPMVQARYEAEIENLDRQNQEIMARLKDLETGESALSLLDIGETLEMSKALKNNYLEASPEKRKRLHKLLFRTVRVTRRELAAGLDDEDEAPTISPFYFVWNEPFRSLWEIGYIQNMAEVAGLRTKVQKTYESGVGIEERA